jgi:hypothetical protein
MLLLGSCGPSSEGTRAGSWATGAQFGSPQGERAYALAVDGDGSVYVGGFTEGALLNENAGLWDAFVRKYSSSGAHLWTRQFGTSSDDYVHALAVDGDGNVYAVGATGGLLSGRRLGGWDAFVRKYSKSGAHLWTEQFGDWDHDYANAVGVDASGNVYVAGGVTVDHSVNAFGPAQVSLDAYLWKFASDGTFVWSQELGTTLDDAAYGVAVDGNGDLYVVGYTSGALVGSSEGKKDGFLWKFNAGGAALWAEQFGTSRDDDALGVAVDASGNVYVAGTTGGELARESLGGVDAYVRSYDSNGKHRWIQQFGTSSDDYAYGVAVDGTDRVYVAGGTTEDLAGPNGVSDAYLRLYDSRGYHQWTQQFGTSGAERCTSVAVDSGGNAYVAGDTGGPLVGRHVGDVDGFVVRLAEP